MSEREALCRDCREPRTGYVAPGGGFLEPNDERCGRCRWFSRDFAEDELF